MNSAIGFIKVLHKEFLYYLEPLKYKKFDAALLHVGVNELLNDENRNSFWSKLVLTYKSAGVTRILVSGVAINNKLASAYISSVWIPTSSLIHLGLSLFKVAKCIFANNFIDE